jgi:hypothetical protein
MGVPDVKEMEAASGNDRPRMPEFPVLESPSPLVWLAKAAQ